MLVFFGIVSAIVLVSLGCVALAYFTDDPVLASGCIEEGQVW